MHWYPVKVYEGCPVPTVLWNIVSLVNCASGIIGPLCLYYVFFPKEDTNPSIVLAGAAIGIPLFFICVLLRKPIDKLGEKQLNRLKERKGEGNTDPIEQNIKTFTFQGKRNTQKPQYMNTFFALGFVLIIFIFCYFYSLRR